MFRDNSGLNDDHMEDINNISRVIFMEDHIPIRLDRTLLLGRQTSRWFLWEMDFQENNS